MSVDRAREPLGDADRSYILQELRVVRGSLPPSEARVVDTILEDPYAFLRWSTADLAARAGTSGATVVRTCRALGFTGLRDLRLTLARDLRFPQLTPQEESEEDGSFVQLVFAEAGRSIASMVTGETAKEFEQAVTCLVEAERILAVAAGPTQVLAQDFADYAKLAGYAGECWSDAIMQSVAAAQLSERDVCLAVSHTGVNALTIQAAEAGAAAGAKVVAVTGYRRSRLVDLATVAIVADTFDFSTPHRAMINTAGLLLLLRSLVAAMDQARNGGGPSAPSMHDVVERLDAFTYRRS